MFTTLMKLSISKEYGRNQFDRYYQEWENAKKEMDSGTEDLLKSGYKIIRAWDEFNHEKGFYIYEKHFRSTDGEEREIHLTLIDSYFQD